MIADEVVRAHREWKEHFLVTMAKREQVDVAVVSADNKCKFGVWLHGEAKDAFGKQPSYAQCVALHAAFHREAGKVAERINAGEYQLAGKMMANGSSYAKSSEALTIAVIAMFNEAKAA